MPSAPIENLSQLYLRPGFMLRRAHQISVAIFEGSCARLGLSPAQYAVLVALHELPGSAQGQLGRVLGMNKVTVSQVVKVLEERGWVARTTGTGDRRCRQLVLTRSGKSTIRRAAGMVQQAYDTLMSPFDATERALFTQLLQKAVCELEPHARAALEPIAEQDGTA
ncbi:MarR family transcriptional regulator [Massilia agilis]|uniref:MarR family transcriptional regulator n=1 Tax=Massilia agilis TaxID=1811226 RepID=A0ABT2DGJ5_9BURK|nr:MarR family transcriptional regulator [Massilia agilis]MCS0810451.1 MarR family transcriptional regulator [Massilia agilis]